MELNEEQAKHLAHLVSLARIGAAILMKEGSSWDHPSIAPFKSLMEKDLPLKNTMTKDLPLKPPAKGTR